MVLSETFFAGVDFIGYKVSICASHAGLEEYIKRKFWWTLIRLPKVYLKVRLLIVVDFTGNIGRQEDGYGTRKGTRIGWSQRWLGKAKKKEKKNPML